LGFLGFFEKYSNTKFQENPSSGSRVVPCGQTDGQNEIVPFRNFANAPKNVSMSAVILQLKVLQQFLPFVFRIKAMK